MRAVTALLVGAGVGLLLAAGAAALATWAALSALGFNAWFNLATSIFETTLFDFGPSFVVAVLAWIPLDRLNLRAAKVAAALGVAAFYLVPRLIGLLLMHEHFWSGAIAAVLMPESKEIVVGGGLALLMWRIAYRRRDLAKAAGVFS